MHYLLAERYKQANDRIQAAVEVLAKDFDLPDDTTTSLNVRSTDLDKTMTFRAEAAADVLERIVEGHKAHKAKLREAKKDAKIASEEANALQSQVSETDALKSQIEKLKAENAELKKSAKTVPSPAPAQPQETDPTPSLSPASQTETTKPAGDQ